MPRPRQTTGPLTPGMRSALARHQTLQPATVRGLVARGLHARGSSRLRLRPTALGRQIGQILAEHHHLREAMVTIERLAKTVRPHVHREDVVAGVDAIQDLALRAVSRTRRWVP